MLAKYTKQKCCSKQENSWARYNIKEKVKKRWINLIKEVKSIAE